ncbi:hypothetical protein [Heliophilum fasciatum]|uniref:Hydrogenase-4 component E n=1 Tax=Heliophilum fasciatum TaxID=35700 RepID=A0A4R2RG13_9FIRM|nr:hypothetical protein [Heliophilum fasciatum]MCW2278677.1 hydrogenase-4 component E [Heliophilum fasciatum]TCP62602.1 hydrogenase-4 component E [Heliophilum fasciatum]
MQLVEIVGTVLLLAAIWLVGNRRLDRAVVNLTIQALLLTLVALITAVVAGVHHMYGVALLLFLIKVVAMPMAFFWALRRSERVLEMQPVLSPVVATVGAVALVVMVYFAVGSIRLPVPAVMSGLLPVSLSVILLGILTMITHRKALLQVVGLMTMENGLFMLAMASTFGMPFIVELGIFFDVLVSAVIMGGLTHQMKVVFASTDTDRLNQLRG